MYVFDNVDVCLRPNGLNTCFNSIVPLRPSDLSRYKLSFSFMYVLDRSVSIQVFLYVCLRPFGLDTSLMLLHVIVKFYVCLRPKGLDTCLFFRK